MKHPRIHSTCPHDCPSACALEVEKVDANTIGRIYGAKANSYTDGVICAKVANYQERIHHPQRLLKPLRRNGAKGDGRSAFQEISWESALDAVAEGLLKAEQRYGAEAIWPYYYAGTMGLIQRDGINRLRHCKGYSGQHSTICSSAAGAGWDAGVGAMRGVDAREIEHSDLVVLWGCNAVHTQINLMHHTTRSRKQNGAQVVVIDPYRTATADKADVHLMLRPGTDGALACAVMHVLFNENYADRDYLRKYTDVPEELEAHLKTKTPAWAATITGLSTAEIINFAHLYGRSKASFIRASYGFTRTRNGATNMHAVSCLPAITGAWQYKGGGALYSNSGLSNVNTNLIEGLDEINPATRILDQSRIGPILTGDKSDLGDGPPVNALFIQNTNPLVVMPASGQVRKGFMRDDLFVCVHEQFMTETAVGDECVPWWCCVVAINTLLFRHQRLEHSENTSKIGKIFLLDFLMHIFKDRVVTIEYTITDDGGQVVDTTDNAESLAFIQGRGTLFPALEEALDGRVLGEKMEVVLTPEQAYGVRDEALVKKVPRDHVNIPGDIGIGLKLRSRKSEGGAPITVVDFDDETVTLDANNPLAGATLTINLVIVDVREAAVEELETGRIQDAEEVFVEEQQGAGVKVDFKT